MIRQLALILPSGMRTSHAQPTACKPGGLTAREFPFAAISAAVRAGLDTNTQTMKSRPASCATGTGLHLGKCPIPAAKHTRTRHGLAALACHRWQQARGAPPACLPAWHRHTVGSLPSPGHCQCCSLASRRGRHRHQQRTACCHRPQSPPGHAQPKQWPNLAPTRTRNNANNRPAARSPSCQTAQLRAPPGAPSTWPPSVATAALCAHHQGTQQRGLPGQKAPIHTGEHKGKRKRKKVFIYQYINI